MCVTVLLRIVIIEVRPISYTIFKKSVLKCRKVGISLKNRVITRELMVCL